MSDNKRELVELAAKAAGYKIAMYEGNGVAWIHETSDERFAPICWCPMYDDGDALRLAVKCGLLNLDDVLFYYGGTIDFQHDPYAATRLAIVRNAAEIGRKMV